MRFALGLTLIAGITLASADRVINLKNKCGSNVYFQVTAGAAPNVQNNGASCNSNADCVGGSYCAGNHICFWNTPSSISAGGGFGLAPGETRVMSMPYLSTDVVWSGNIAACVEGKGCGDQNFTHCRQAGCGSSGAVSLAEFTLVKYGQDFYDISIINGINVAMSMTPSISSTRDDYTCKAAGAVLDGNTWHFNAPSNDFVWVSLESPLQGCNSDADCHNGFVCGLSRNPAGNVFKKSCGTKLGYWTADQVCGMNGGMGAPFNCQMASGINGWTLQNYLLCSGGTPSCYQNGAPSSCCGCANWWQIGVPQVSANSQPCKNTNPFWTANVLPNLMFLKKGCPKCYTFPYDDITSTFVCSNGNQATGTLNSVNYDVTFCPNGNAF
jgi:hypothetical protein